VIARPWLVLGLVACASTTTPPASLSQPGPSLEAVCPTTPPAGNRVERGVASDPDRAVALGEARQAATEQLLERLCDGLRAGDCAQVAQAIRPWKDGYHDAASNFACASVAVASDVLDGFETRQQRLEQDLGQLAQGIVDAAGDDPIRLLEPTWSEGCEAGTVGAKIGALVTNEVAGLSAIPLAAQDADASEVVMTLTPGRGAITLEAQLRRPDGSRAALRGFTAPIEALPIAADARLGCAPAEPEVPPGRDVSDRAAVVEWLTGVVTQCEARLGGDLGGVDQWWVRFKVEDDRVRGVNVGPGLDSSAPDDTTFAVANCIREGIKAEDWSGGPSVFKSAIRSSLPSGVRDAPPPLPSDQVSLVIRNPDRDWLDVRVDGKVVAELRNSAEATVAIDAGTHRIEVLEFMAGEPFYAGTLTTADRDEIVLGVDVDDASVVAYDGVGLAPL